MNLDEFMSLFGRESDEDIEDAEVVEPAAEPAETSEDSNDVVTAQDDNNSADLEGEDDSTAFINDDSAPEEHEEADVDLDPATDILEEIADDEEASGFDKQMEVPTVVDKDTVFDELQDLTDVQVHNIAEKEEAQLSEIKAELDELLSDSGDTYDETEFDAIPENDSAEEVGGVDPLEPAEHPVTAMLDERIEDNEQNGMLMVSTKDQDMDASDFLAQELNDDDTYSCDGSDDCECSNCEETPAEEPAESEPVSVTEDEDEDVVPKDAEPEDEEEESDSEADVDAEAEELEDDSEEADEEKAEAGDTSDLEISEDDVPAEEPSEDAEGDSEEGNIFDDPETFDITDDMVDNMRMPEYTFTPSITLDEQEEQGHVADAETIVKDDDVEVQEVEGGDDTPAGGNAEEAPTEAEADTEVEAEAEVEETSEEAPEETESEEETEDEVKPAEECGETDVVPENAEPEGPTELANITPSEDGEAASDAETIDAEIKNDQDADFNNLYKEVNDVITVGDDETALDDSSFIVDDEGETGSAEPDTTNNDPTEFQDIEEVEMDSQDLSDILAELEDEPHNIDDSEGSVDETPAEAEVAEEPTEDVETEEEISDTDDVEEADEAIESLFANLDNFRL